MAQATVAWCEPPPPDTLARSHVLLISMPFGPLLQPSIGLELLRAALKEVKTSAKVLYLTLPFARRIGPPLYSRIANGEPATFDLVGEWIFAETLFGPSVPDAARYVNDVLRGGAPAHRLTHDAAKPVSDAFVHDVLAARACATPRKLSASPACSSNKCRRWR